MKNINLKKYLESIGKSTFIKYFECFQQNYNTVSNDILFANFANEGWTQSSKNTKASIGKKIFKEGLEFDALEFITSSLGIDERTKIRAKELCQEYELDIPTIESTKIIPTDKEKDLLFEIYEFAVKEGLDIEDIVSSMLDRVNEALGSDKTASFEESENGYKFEVRFGNSSVEVLDVVADEVKTLNLPDYKIDSIKKRTVIKKAKEFNNTFKNRLNSQDRKYANGLCYMPTIFNKLAIDFKQNIKNQRSNIFVFIKQNDQAVKVNINDISEIRIEKGQVFGKISGSKVELFFKYENELHSFLGYIDTFTNISLGHVKSVYRILNESIDSLPTLKQVSDIVIKADVNIKRKKYSDLIVEEIQKQNVDIDALKRELAQIDAEMKFELIPLRINIAMGKN